jgi:hypothetical protein
VNSVEVRDLLSYAASLDRWLRTSDPEAAELMLTGWAELLASVPYAVAREAVQRHYSVHQERTVTPGDLLDAWRESLRTDSSAEALRAPRTDGGPARNVGTYLRAVQDAVAAGQPVESVPVPPGEQLSDTADAWSRRCSFHTICACSHRKCRGGWLDEETTVTNGQGATYPAVRRCPVCVDGILMAEERGIARKPRRAAGARR